MNQKISENNKQTWKDKKVRQKRIEGIERSTYGCYTKRELFEDLLRELVNHNKCCLKL